MVRNFVAAALLLAPLALAQTPDACAQACIDAADDCRTTRVNGISANQAQCSAEFAKCLGYNPYEGSNRATPTACSTSSAAPSATAYGTSSASSATSYSAPPAPTYAAGDLGSCAKDCATKYDTCRTTRVNGLSANQAQCASEYSSCLRFNPFTQTAGSTFSTPTACAASSTSASASTTAATSAAASLSPCAQDCATKYDTCRSTRVNGLSANQAQCASEYASCLNFNPFTQNGSGTFVTPTACSTQSSSPAAATTGVVTSTNTVVASPQATATSLVTSQAPSGAAPAPAATTSVTPSLTNGVGALSPANILWAGLAFFML